MKYLVRGERTVEGQLPTITFHKKTKNREEATKVASKYLDEHDTAFCVCIIPLAALNALED